jgi:hypothetical protein
MWDPLRIPATLDPATGQITCDNAGTNFGGDILARWYPDEEQGSDTELSPDDTGDNAWELANAGPGGSDSRGGQDRGG